MADPLRTYLPQECDERGWPLDFERCRTCNVDSDGTPLYPDGKGARDFPPADPEAPVQEMCPTCGSHGSRKAAALNALAWLRLERGPPAPRRTDPLRGRGPAGTP